MKKEDMLTRRIIFQIALIIALICCFIATILGDKLSAIYFLGFAILFNQYSNEK